MMSVQAVMFWLLNLFCDTFGQMALKYASRSTGDRQGLDHWRALARSPLLWLGIFAFVFEMLFWLSFLAEVPLAMGLFIGCANIVSVLLFGHWLFDEALPKRRLMAIGLIVIGVGLVGWGGL